MEDKIKTWNDLINKYFLLEEECNTNINLINDIRNYLKNNLTYLCKDDIVFYSSIIDNSYFYLINSLKINQIKFLKDLNKIYIHISRNNKNNSILKIINLNKSDINLIINSYIKLKTDVTNLKKTNTIFKWIKDDIENLQQIEDDITETITYHIKLLEFLLEIIKLKYNFYNSN
jgi:hypothetical protein